MRWTLFSVFLVSGGCSFAVNGFQPASSDMPGGGNTSLDLAGAASSDLAVAGGADLSASPPVDMAGAPPPDLAPPYTPSHVSAGDFHLGTQPLTVMTSIRTDPGNLLVDGAPVPAGVSFAVENNLAVLAASAVNVPAGA
ncbi:MAG TPA: hypothetical protein VF945_15455, partial [Polyangia bacterium]